MPVCPSCGTPNEGRYCAKCGALVDTGGAPAPSGTAALHPQSAAVVSGSLEDNVAGALCYLVWIVTGILFLVIQPYGKRPFVRFHAFQSILLTAVWIAINIVLNILMAPLNAITILLTIRSLIGLVAFLVWLFCMYKAYNREMYQLPLIGAFAAKQAAA